MKEREKVVHLLILVVYTVFELILTIESKLMNWENGPILLLFIGLIVCWALYITEKIPPSIQLWLVYTLTMLYDFLYVVQTPMSMDELTVSRTLLHFALVFTSGYLTRASLERQKHERKFMNKLIEDLEENNRRTGDIWSVIFHQAIE